MLFYFILAVVLGVQTRKLDVGQHLRSYDLKQISRHIPIENSLLDYHQVEYLITIQIGSQKQTFDIMIDTGSSDLWVPQVGAKGFKQLKRKDMFECSDSSTCVDTDESIQVYYDDGPVSGTLVWDQVCFNSCESVLPKQSFLLVDKAGDNMRNSPGILGLSFQHISSNPNPTILTTMVSDHLIPQKLFSLYLTDKGKTGSKIVFGGTDPSYQQIPNSPFTYAPLSSTDIYQISVVGVSLNNRTFSVKHALVDSGTSCLTMPHHVIDKLVESLKTDYGIQCEFHVESYAPSYSLTSCHTNEKTSEAIIAQFPLVEIVIDSQNTLTLHPADYIYHCKLVSGRSYSTVCLTKLERSEIDSQMILGDAFLQSFYTIFDQEKMRVGFSHSINNGVLKVKNDEDEDDFHKAAMSKAHLSALVLILTLVLQ